MDKNSMLYDKNVREKHKNALAYYGKDKNTNKQKPMFWKIFMLSFLSYKLLLEISLLFADPSIDMERLRNELTSLRERKMVLSGIEQAQTLKEKFEVHIRDNVMHDTVGDTEYEEKGCEVGDDTGRGENGREVGVDTRSLGNNGNSRKLRKCNDREKNSERKSVVMGPRNNDQERMRMATYCLKCLGKRKRDETEQRGITCEGEPMRKRIRLNSTYVKKVKEKRATNSIYIKSLKRRSFLSYADAMPSGDYDNQDNNTQGAGFWSGLKNMFNDKILKNGQRFVDRMLGRNQNQDLQINATGTGNARTDAGEDLHSDVEGDEDFYSYTDDTGSVRTDVEEGSQANADDTGSVRTDVEEGSQANADDTGSVRTDVEEGSQANADDTGSVRTDVEEDLQTNADDTGSVLTDVEEGSQANADDTGSIRTDAGDTHPAHGFNVAVRASSQATEHSIASTKKSFMENGYATVSIYCSSAMKWIGNSFWGMMGYGSSEGQRDGSANATTHDDRANIPLASISPSGLTDDLTDGSSAGLLVSTHSINNPNLSRNSLDNSIDADGCSDTTKDRFTRWLNFENETPQTTHTNTPTEEYDFSFEDRANLAGDLPVQRDVSANAIHPGVFHPHDMRSTGLPADHSLLDSCGTCIASDDQSLNDSVFEHEMSTPDTLSTCCTPRSLEDSERIADTDFQAEPLTEIADNNSSKSEDSSNNYCRLKRNHSLNDRMLSRQISTQSQIKQPEPPLNVSHSKSEHSANSRPPILPLITMGGSGSGGGSSDSGGGTISGGGGGSNGGGGGGSGGIDNNKAPDPENTDQNDDRSSHKSMSVVTRILLCVVLLILIALAITAFYYGFKW
ncbi:hypothetical protein VCUG_00320 [Vavraia culicis subsp. floridensis]|uniref:Uncharacterized protein n=1 Tax=Vavraia culicis (isolate floridensis) TaxID=948595 RepID=L2GXB1_VAVCU|nr:uncharacterized protein VCUG_00320 [Vavraia culicis subsp. floridensis]ELA48279.1 hypothetical protein VCUG_00320 [Vavraia culicis subsp. floridensis]